MKLNHLFVPFLFLLTILVVSCGGSTPNSTHPEYVVRIKSNFQTPRKNEATAKAIAQDYGGNYIRNYEASEFFLVRLDPNKVQAVDLDLRTRGIGERNAESFFDCSVPGDGNTKEDTARLADAICSEYGVVLEQSFVNFFVVKGKSDVGPLLALDDRLGFVVFAGVSEPAIIR